MVADREPVAWRLRRLPLFADGPMPEREPALGELLDDPIARQLMASDGVVRHDVESLIDRLKSGHFARQPYSQRR